MLKRLHLRAALLLLTAFCALSAYAAPNLTKYPLRVNIVYSNSGYYWAKPTLGGPALDVSAAAGALGDDSAPGAGLAGGLTLNYDDILMFYGNGKANLTTTPNIQGFTFTYDECLGRLGVTAPDKPFYARWKKANKVLELVVQVEPQLNKPNKPISKQKAKYDKCDVYVSVQKNIYLLLRSGTIMTISPDDLAKKPTLRQFTQGMDPKLMPRPAAANPTPRRVPMTTGNKAAAPAPTAGSASRDASPSSPPQ